MTRRIRIAQTDELEAEQLEELTRLCEAAFGIPFGPVWERVGPGLHIMAEEGGTVVAHAMIVDRRIYLGHEPDLALDVGYIENVATLPELHGQGHGAAVMRRAGQVIGEEYALGALATTTHSFYEKVGCERWLGPTSVRTPDGERVRTARRDGHVMILRTPRTPSDLRNDEPIAIDWRPGEPW